MLDNGTKQRIDTARNILVGKVPDPKSQVEQITIALIYKFMDDMDQESLSLGGTASFFVGEYEKYGWTRMFDPRLGGFDMLALYADAITRMSENPHIPQLFREIFKNAYLPYRDPETLKLFLKTINEFHYDHSERLGDAFEYLLSVLGSQGDAGQFRTPRHIIEFMVAVVVPKKHETIMDPACGTAGFLISAYKHIRKQNTIKEPGDQLSMQDRTHMVDNFTGYDISPDMVRLSLVNMYLHGFVTPQIFEYDTLSSEDHWHEYADVILANPPFMSPKGGIRPHKKFSVQSKRSEVLFVDYMAEHLTPNGRAAIIVPEGIIFQSGTAYKELRKYLVEKNYLWAVVSLPSGVFNPYAGVKTSILFLDKVVARKTDRVLFVKVQNDGFDLGAQRRPIDKNDLPAAQRLIQDWQQAVVEKGGEGFDLNQYPEIGAQLVEKSRLAESGGYNLSGERYSKIIHKKKTKYDHEILDNVCERIVESINPNNQSGGINFIGLENIESNTGKLVGNIFTNYGNIKSLKSCFQPGDVLYGKLRPNLNKVHLAKFSGICSTDIFVLRSNGKIVANFLSEVLRSKQFNEKVLLGLGGAQLPRVNYDYLRKLEFPLPPLEIQHEIVAEIEGHQHIIDGARMVIENWKPNIELELEEARKEAGVEEWEMVKLGDECIIARGGSPRPINKYITKDNTGVNWIKIGDVGENAKYIEKTKEKIIIEGTKKSRKVIIGDFVLSNSMSFGRPYIMKIEGYIHDGWLLIRENKDRVYKDYLYYVLQSKLVKDQFEKSATGGVVRNLNSDLVRKVEILLPPIQIQKEIVKNIETEWKIIDMNNRLILNYKENK